MKRRNVLLTILITLAVTALTSQIRIATAHPATISVSPTVTNKPVNETFSINVTVSDVSAMWGYQFSLWYNTTILTATNAESYAPFTEEAPSEIVDDYNATHGYVAWARHSYSGDTTGLTTIGSAPITRIDFRVDANGTTILHFDTEYTLLADVHGMPITYTIADGYFSNVEEIPLHDIAVTSVTVSTTTVKPGDMVSIDVIVENQGDFNDTFSVTTFYNQTTIQTQYNIFLEAGKTKALAFTWNTTDVADGAYLIRAIATNPQESDPADNTGFADDYVTVKSPEAGFLIDTTLLIVAGVVIVVIVVAGVYIVKARKPK